MKLPETALIVKADNCISTKIGENTVLLNLETGKYIKLNDTATLIWEKINSGIKIGLLIKEIAQDYGVSSEKVNEDIKSFLRDALLKKIFLLDDQ